MIKSFPGWFPKDLTAKQRERLIIVDSEFREVAKAAAKRAAAEDEGRIEVGG